MSGCCGEVKKIEFLDFSKISTKVLKNVLRLRIGYGWLRISVTDLSLVNTGGYGWLRIFSISFNFR